MMLECLFVLTIFACRSQELTRGEFFCITPSVSVLVFGNPSGGDYRVEDSWPRRKML
jgi:hypothetical protein